MSPWRTSAAKAASAVAWSGLRPGSVCGAAADPFLDCLAVCATDPTRLRILSVLARGECSVTELRALLRESAWKISRHLATLRALRVVTFRHEDNRRVYRLTDSAAARALAAFLMVAEAEGPQHRGE